MTIWYRLRAALRPGPRAPGLSRVGDRITVRAGGRVWTPDSSALLYSPVVIDGRGVVEDA